MVRRPFIALRLWILVATVFVATGWLSSAIGMLNLVTYAAVTFSIVLASLCLVPWRRIRLRLLLPRFRRPLPAAYGLMSGAALLGGILHAPNNYDALSYRLPRLLAWFAAGHWTWINTTSQRMNYSAENSEWLSAPIFLLTRSDRLLFLPNLISFLLLPGLIFSVYRMLGVRMRVAWAWMWVLPAAFCFALQAASIGNDLIGVVFILAALYFGLLASCSKSFSDAALALLALALATGIKGSNLPLVLPALIALWPARHLYLRRPITSVGVLATTFLVSYMPTAILNHHFTGDWKGDPRNTEALQVGSPLAGILGNTLQLSAQNLQPPLLPGASILDKRMASLLPRRVQIFLKHEFPRFELHIGELPQEEAAGLGLPLIALLTISLCGRCFTKIAGSPGSAQRNRAIALIPWFALAAFLCYLGLIGSESSGRLLSPYYLVLLPLLAYATNGNYMKKKWWEAGALVVIGSTILVLVLTPARPLWPAQTVLEKLQSRWPESEQLWRAGEVYAVYRERNDLLQPLRERLPPDAARIGIIADDNDLDYGLWRPFGARTLSYLIGTRGWEQESRGFTWIVGKTSLLVPRYGGSLDELRQISGAQIVATQRITSRVSRGPEEWFVMKLPERRAEPQESRLTEKEHVRVKN
jgi:hypothetical protein